MTTIVSAFMTLKERPLDSFLVPCEKLLKINTPKIIFVDDAMYERIKEYQNENTILIHIDEDLYNKFNSLRNSITNFHVNTGNLTKDTLEFIILQCMKTDFVRKAIELNHYNTDQYMWMDFRLFHVFNDNEQVFTECVLNACTKCYSSVRIAGYSHYDRNANIYKDVIWKFLGGVFGGHKDALVRFAILVDEECNKIISETKSLMWEVNVWKLISDSHPELFDIYDADHNPAILSNY